jgi:ribonuclease BN (tRNA processing enzyme)
LDDVLAFITDADYDPATADFVRGVRVLVNEAANRGGGGLGGAEPEQNGHCTPEQAATTAKDAGAGELLLSHLPFTDPDVHADMLARARAIFPRTNLCSDGLSRTIE